MCLLAIVSKRVFISFSLGPLLSLDVTSIWRNLHSRTFWDVLESFLGNGVRCAHTHTHLV